MVIYKNSPVGDNRRLNDTILLGVFSIPYIYDFVCGIFGMILINRIARFNKIMHKLNNKDEESQKFLDDVF